MKIRFARVIKSVTNRALAMSWLYDLHGDVDNGRLLLFALRIMHGMFSPFYILTDSFFMAFRHRFSKYLLASVNTGDSLLCRSLP